MSANAAMAVDEYPYARYNGPGSAPSKSIWTDSNGKPGSPYGYYYRNCTDFVAWALDAHNKFEIPPAIGDAGNWGSWASRASYRIDSNPTVGAVAWWRATDSNPFGHVAWVKDVTGSTVTVEEYNRIVNGAFDGAYHIRKISASEAEYIHFKDIAGAGEDSGDPVGDFNGNGKDDILWYGPGSRPDAIWYGSGNRNLKFNKSFGVTVGGKYTPIKGDFNGDHYGDVLWYGPGNAPDAIWQGTNTKGKFTAAAVSVQGTYTPVSGDFNGDGKDDILWYGPGSRGDAIWYGSRDRSVKFDKSHRATVGGTSIPVSGDFDGDRHGDIVWYGPGEAPDSIWYGRAAKGMFSTAPLTVNGSYVPIS